MKTIDDMALEVAEVTLQLMKDTTDWVLADVFLSDEYNAIHAAIIKLAINKMYMQTKHDNESII